jgi:hypothetical protein
MSEEKFKLSLIVENPTVWKLIIILLDMVLHILFYLNFYILRKPKLSISFEI